MDQILSQVYIGNLADSQNYDLLQKAGIRSVLSLIEIGDQSKSDDGLERVVVPLIDGAGNDSRQIREAIDSLTYLLKHVAPVLVHCRAGRSRSPLVVAGHLAQAENIPLRAALNRISRKREIHVTGVLVQQLERMLA